MMKREVKKYKDKLLNEVNEGRRGSVYRLLRQLGDAPGSKSRGSFNIASHTEQDMTSLKSAETLAQYFSQISTEFLPLSLNNLTKKVCDYLTLTDPVCGEGPVLSAFQVAAKIKMAKKPNSFVPIDVHPKLMKTFSVEFAAPAASIFNTITKQKVYPKQWKVEYGIPIPKIALPQIEDDVRVISKTPFLSKIYESFVVDWLLQYIRPFLDPAQCGGLKGVSVNHYLIKLLNFIHAFLD